MPVIFLTPLAFQTNQPEWALTKMRKHLLKWGKILGSHNCAMLVVPEVRLLQLCPL